MIEDFIKEEEYLMTISIGTVIYKFNCVGLIRNVQIVNKDIDPRYHDPLDLNLLLNNPCNEVTEFLSSRSLNNKMSFNIEKLTGNKKNTIVKALIEGGRVESFTENILTIGDCDKMTVL